MVKYLQGKELAAGELRDTADLCNVHFRVEHSSNDQEVNGLP